MQRPVVVISLLFITGIFLGSIIQIPIYFIFGICFFFWVLCTIGLCLPGFVFLLSYILPAFLLATSIAFYNVHTYSVSSDHISHILTTEKTIQRLRGTVIVPPLLYGKGISARKMKQFSSIMYSGRNNYKISFLFRARQIETVSGWKGTDGILKVNVYMSETDITRLNNEDTVFPHLTYGKEVEMLGYAFLPAPPGNPGEFNYQRYLQRKKPSISGILTLVNPYAIEIQGESNGKSRAYYFVYALKNFLNGIIYTNTFHGSAPLISSILLGNREDLSAEVMDNFIKTGVIHFIAISGFHVGIVAFTVFLPLRILGVNQYVSTGVVLFVIAIYALITGMNPPVLRASIMVAVFFFSRLVSRQWDVTSGIFTAVFFILLRNPSDLFNIGFQLSLSATMGIVYGTSRIERFLFKEALFIERLQEDSERGRLFFLKTYLRKSFCVSLAAWLATLPLTAYYFHIFTPLVPAVNIIAFPFFWLIIVCGIGLLTLGAFCHPLASIAAWIVSRVDVVLESLVSILSSLPFSHFYISGPSLMEIVVYYLFLLFLFYYKNLKLSLAQIFLWGLLSANILVYSGIIRSLNRPFSITCLDVGHGCAIIIQFPNGKNILYDAGSWKNYDVGKYIIAPFLWKQGIKKIDLVILSHEHQDHCNGILSLVERFSIRHLFSQRFFFASKAGQQIISTVSSKQVKTASISSGVVIKGFEPATITVIHPHPFISQAYTSNDNCCVIRIDYLGHSVLLCGDIREQGIESILTTNSRICSDILQIPHHGSWEENLERLLRCVQPQYAFINSDNTIISSKTLDLLQRYGTKTFQVHQKGAVTFILNANGITCSWFR